MLKNLIFQSVVTRPFMAVAVFAVLLMSGVMVSHAAAQSKDDAPAGSHLVTIHDRGQERVIMTDEKTIGDALEAAEVSIDPEDNVEPSLSEEMIASKYTVNIYRARPVVIVDGTTRVKIVSAFQTPKQIAKEANIELFDEDRVHLAASTDIARDGVSMRMEIDRATPFTLVLYGKKIDARTNAKTVGDMLKEKNISPNKEDTLSVDKAAPIVAGMSVELWRNGVQTVTEDQDVEFPVEKIQDANRPVGYREVKTPGEKGSRSVTFEIEMRNGQEISRKEIQSVTTKEPKKQVEIVGAKFNYTGGPLSEEQLNALGQCESGMTATRNSGNGFYGAFQFMPSTWKTQAPAEYKNVLPHEAPLDAQKQAVQNLLSKSSIYTQFPGCAKKMQAQGIL